MRTNAQHQTPPAKIYRSHDLVVVALPMAGLGPEDIRVEVTADGRLVVEGELRVESGFDAEERAAAAPKEVLLDEWTVGPYRRELELPAAVDGPRATVTYGNGVVVVALPIADRTRAASLTLASLSPTRGERAANPLHPQHPQAG